MLSMEIGPDSSAYCVIARKPKVACNQICVFIPKTGGEGTALCHMMSVSKSVFKCVCVAAVCVNMIHMDQ